ncbi:MAG: UMP kinase [Planctomycetes bacterium]|nr:UMP kinase [Planctomycetota bacterium]
MTAGEAKYRRIVLKVSGEGLAREGRFGIDEEALAVTAGEIAAVTSLGVQVALVIGGGNFFRGRQAAGSRRVARTTADTMGMLATTMNALALRDCLQSIGIDGRVMGTVTTEAVSEPFVARRAVRHLQAGRVILLAGGTGHPFFTTDTCAALRAAELGADAMLKATKVDGVFSADPVIHPDAERFAHLTYQEVLTRRLGVMDMTDVSLCMDAAIPVIVFKFTTPGNTLRVVRGEDVGTTISL